MRKTGLFKQFLTAGLIISLSVLSSCSNLKLVTSYDDGLYQETVKVKNDVDNFYEVMLEDDQNKRQYVKFGEKYLEIQSEIEALNTRNKSKDENKESTTISNSILDLWKKYKGKHKLKDNYTTSNAELDRVRFARLFDSAENAETAKKRKKK